LNNHHRPFDAVLFDLGSTLIYFDCDTTGVFDRMDAAMIESLLASGIKLDRGPFLQKFNSRMRLYDSQRGSEFLEITTAYNLSAVMQETGLDQPPQSVINAALKARYAVSQSCYKAEEGVVTVLEGLRAAGYRLGIVSNASDDDDVQTLIDNARLRPYFDVIVSSAAQGIRKPNPRIFLKVLSQLGVEPGRAMMVGDMLGADVLGAHNAGIYAVWITRRADKAANRDHLDTIRPDAVIASIDELPGLLDSI
jgi:putative hydrolase of the HAD superfamily